MPKIVADCHRTGIRHGTAIDRSHRDGRVIDHPVDDHVRNVIIDIDRVRRDRGNFPGELVFAF
jgi:hypothetical protein